MYKIQLALGRNFDVEIHELEVTSEAHSVIENCCIGLSELFDDFSWSITKI